MKKMIYFYLFILAIFICSCSGRQVTPKVLNIYSGNKGSDIYIDTEKEKGVLLFQDKEASLGVTETTNDNQWVIVQQAFVPEGPGRVITVELLFNTVLRMKVEDSDFGPDFYSVNGFEKEKNKEFVLIGDKKTGKEQKYDLKDLYKKLKQRKKGNK